MNKIGEAGPYDKFTALYVTEVLMIGTWGKLFATRAYTAFVLAFQFIIIIIYPPVMRITEYSS